MLKTMLWSAGFISFIVVITLSLIIVLAMTPEIQGWITTPVPSAEPPHLLELPSEHIFIITPWPVLLFSISGAAFQAWHIAILAILMGGFIYAKYDLFKSWASKKGAAILSLTVPEKASSSMEAVCKLFMASIFFSTCYFLFLELINVEMQTPGFDELSRPELIYALFSASVFEELISRVLLIGVPVVLIGLALKWKNPIRKILGGGLDITPATFALITFSAVIFAFAHVGGWDYWKVPQVLIPGFALGFAFVRYGLHASMLIHFSINLSSAALEIWPDNIVVQALLSVAIIVWIVAGGYFFFRYSADLVKKLAPGLLPTPVPAYAPYQYHGTPPPGYSPQGYYQPPAYPYYPPPPPQYHSQWPPPPPPRFCLGCGLQIQPSYNHCPHCGKSVPPLPATPQPTYFQPPPLDRGGFVCPNCRNTGASYDTGKLICLKCGAVHVREKAPDAPVEKRQVEF